MYKQHDDVDIHLAAVDDELTANGPPALLAHWTLIKEYSAIHVTSSYLLLLVVFVNVAKIKRE